MGVGKKSIGTTGCGDFPNPPLKHSNTKLQSYFPPEAVCVSPGTLAEGWSCTEVNPRTCNHLQQDLRTAPKSTPSSLVSLFTLFLNFLWVA